ncbi:hypothetical protein AU467_30020 [Mesorhizobium loti]|uniref:Transposase n=1 Tax=Rhizobium loti TaxID=381 RepID=A0A101KPD3_RHILI|nr:hypothetical protein AU467_30020 [Mesorhizobium loti]
MPQAWHRGRDVLQLEEALWRPDASEFKRMRQLEHENNRLKNIVADLTLKKRHAGRTSRAESDEACPPTAACG